MWFGKEGCCNGFYGKMFFCSYIEKFVMFGDSDCCFDRGLGNIC